MSKTCNEEYFNTIEEIESSGEDYNRKYSIERLSKVMHREEAEEFCDNLEARGNMLLDNMAEQQREESGEET